MSLDGVRLTFPDNRVFRITEELTVAHSGQPQWLVDGFRNLVTAYERYIDGGGAPGRSDSFYSAVFEGVGAGVGSITLEFSESVQSGNTWGDAASDATAREKADELRNAITEVRVTSSEPVIFEGGEFSPTGKFSPLTVVFGNWEIRAAFGEGESHAMLTGNLELYDAINTGEPVDATARGE